jgi:hypothetical protein
LFSSEGVDDSGDVMEEDSIGFAAFLLPLFSELLGCEFHQLWGHVGEEEVHALDEVDAGLGKAC